MWSKKNTEGVTVDSLTLSGTVHLILCDGATLTVTNSITGSGSPTLNIYYQLKGTGELSALVKSATVNEATITETYDADGNSTTSYTVTFNSDGGSTVASQTVKSQYGKPTTVKKPADPTKKNYVFGGWYNGEELYDFSTGVTEDITLKAKWISKGGGGSKFTPTDDNTPQFAFHSLMLSGYSKYTVALCKAIQNYGHYAQIMLSTTNGWTLDTDHVTMTAATDKALGSETASKVAKKAITFNDNATFSDIKGDAKLSAMNLSLLLDSATTIRLYVTLDGVDTMTATVDGETVTPVKATADNIDKLDQDVGTVDTTKTVYMVDIPEILAHKLSEDHTVVITANEGTTVTVKLSALSYVNAVLAKSTNNNDKNAVIALYEYYAATMDYRKHTKGYAEYEETATS